MSKTLHVPNKDEKKMYWDFFLTIPFFVTLVFGRVFLLTIGGQGGKKGKKHMQQRSGGPRMLCFIDATLKPFATWPASVL